LPGLGRITVQREQELRVILTARHMAEGGSWVIPRFLDQPRLRKPPLMYWIVATTCLLARDLASPFVARLPGALAGVAMLLVIYAAGRALTGRTRAFTAAVVCATSFLFMRNARLMETDITLSVLVMQSTLAGYLALTRPAQALKWWSLAGLAGGLGFLTKGPAALGIPLLTWLAFALLKPRRIRGIFSARALPGLLVFALLAAPWYAAIFFMTRGDGVAANQLTKELSATFSETHHPGPVYYYVYTLLHAMMPWSLALPFALWSAIKLRHHQGVRFLLTWFAVAFTSLTLVDSKQIHYSTLLLPQSALIIGLFVAPPLYRSVRRRHTILGKAFVVVAALLAGAGMGLAIAPWAGARIAWAPALALGLLLVALGIAATLLRNPRALPWLILPLQCAVLSAAYAYLLHPLQEEKFLVTHFMQASRTAIQGAGHVYASGPHVALLEYYAGRDVTGAKTIDEAWSSAAEGDAVLVSGNRKRPLLDDEFPAPPVRDMAQDDFRCVLFVKDGAAAR
jgi:4-amino-4-deoxy-L-arabinose transferase-like glycosyltransferase